jgi:hypothetical protein
MATVNEPSKNGKWDDVVFDHDGEIDVEATRAERESEPVQYVPPADKQKLRARNLVDIHWPLAGVDKTPAKYRPVMSCVLNHANPKTGRCQVKQKTIAIETGLSLSTVKRAIKWWERRGFLKVQPVGRGRSNAYHPQWDSFDINWTRVTKKIEAEKQGRRSLE